MDEDVASSYRKANEVVFMKCTNTVCAGKTRHPVKMNSFLKQRNFKLFRTEKSADYPDHYATFLELCKDDDQDQPSVDSKQLRRCNSCPVYSFSSKTEKASYFCVPQKSRSSSSFWRPDEETHLLIY